MYLALIPFPWDQRTTSKYTPYSSLSSRIFAVATVSRELGPNHPRMRSYLAAGQAFLSSWLLYRLLVQLVMHGTADDPLEL